MPVLQSHICKFGSVLNGVRVTSQLFNGDTPIATTFGRGREKRSSCLFVT